MSKLIKKIKIKIYNRLINTYTNKIISYGAKRRMLMYKKRHIIDSMVNNNDKGPDKREFESLKSTELAKIDNELYCVSENILLLHNKKDSFESKKRDINISLVN